VHNSNNILACLTHKSLIIEIMHQMLCIFLPAVCMLLVYATAENFHVRQFGIKYIANFYVVDIHCIHIT